MNVEIWRDTEGFRLLFEDNEFDLTDGAYAVLIDTLQDALSMDDEGDYRALRLDLPEDEDGKL